MFKTRRFFSFAVYLLIFQMMVGTLWARIPESSTKNIKIAFVALDKNPKTAQTLQALRSELQRDARLQILNLPNPPALSTSSVPEAKFVASVDFKEAFGQSQELYRDFAFSKAIAVLQKAINDYNLSTISPVKLLPFSQIYVMMGNIYLADQNQAKARESFSQALHFDPQYVISEREYPPSTVKFFKETQESFLKKNEYAKLEIQSDPKSQVYLNGVLRGETPLKVEKQPLGDQWVMLWQEGYQTEKIKINLTSDDFKRKVALEPMGNSLDSLGGISQESRLTRSLSQWGQENGLDQVVTLQTDAGKRIKIQSVDVLQREIKSHASWDFSNLSREVAPTSQKIANYFDKSSPAAVKVSSSTQTSSEKKQSTKKKSLFKKPWLWGVLGAVVVGGAASAFLIGGGGDSNGSAGGIPTTVRGAQSPAP